MTCCVGYQFDGERCVDVSMRTLCPGIRRCRLAAGRLMVVREFVAVDRGRRHIAAAWCLCRRPRGADDPGGGGPGHRPWLPREDCAVAAGVNGPVPGSVA